MTVLTAGVFANWSGGALHGRPMAAVGNPSIDTRTLEKNDCFFALKGPNFDGHAFVNQALVAGASTLVVERAHCSSVVTAAADFDATVIGVDNTELALQRLGVWHRDQFKGLVFGITGSSGKTTTKEMLKTALAPHGEVVATKGNLNNHLGVPLSLSQLSQDADFGVFEMGMNAPNEIRTLSGWVRPDVGIISSIGAAHLEGVGSLEGVAHAKGELFETLAPEAFAVCPSDVPFVAYLESVAQDRMRGVGRSGTSYCRILDVATNGRRTAVIFELNGHTYQLDLPCVGDHHVRNALCALTAIHLLNLSLEPSIEALSAFELPDMRGQHFELRDDVEVVLDCYNANPQSMRAAIDAHNLESDGTQVLVLGDMLELGVYAQSEHQALGDYIAQHCEDSLVIAVGPLIRSTIENAKRAGMASDKLHWFETADAAGAYLSDQVQPRMNILIKGSRGIHLEDVWTQIQKLGVEQ